MRATARRTRAPRTRSASPDKAAPFALIRAERGGLALAAVDAAAAAAGLGPGQRLTDARAILPELATAEEDPRADLAALARLADWCGRYSPWTAPDRSGCDTGGAAGVWLDVTGCAHLFGGEAALLDDLVGRLGRLGFQACAALADTPGAAWAFARFGLASGRRTRICPVGAAEAQLAGLPPAALRLPLDQVELLERLGLRTVGDLIRIPPATLEPRFDRQVARRLDQALGRLPESLSPRPPSPPLLCRLIFAEAIATPEDIARGLERLAAGLCQQLESGQRGARRLELTAYRVDGGLQRLRLGASRGTRDAGHICRLFAEQLERLDPGFGIEVMTLAATLAEPLAALQSAWRPADGKGDGPGGASATTDGDALARLVDRLGSRLGAGNIRALAPRESHLPERAVAPAPPLAVLDRSPAGSLLDKPPTPSPGATWRGAPPRPPRPLRLLERPEPVEAIALLPDYPPRQFRWRRVGHQVVRAEGPERLTPEWWASGRIAGEQGEKGEPGGQAARDYFRVEDEDGRRFWLYRSDGRWFLHGLFG